MVKIERTISQSTCTEGLTEIASPRFMYPVFPNFNKGISYNYKQASLLLNISTKTKNKKAHITFAKQGNVQEMNWKNSNLQ